MSNFVRARSRVATVIVAALALTGISFAVAPTAREWASAAGSNLVCDQNTLYGITSGGDVIQIDATTGATTAVDSFSPATNGLGITQNGTEALAFENGGNTIVRYDPISGVPTTIASPDPDGNQTAIRGAVNPVTNIYYYAGGGASPRLAAYDLDTDTAIGRVGTITGLAGANGDMAFGSDGTLYLVDGDKVYEVGTVPETAGNATLPATEILSLPGGSNSPGIAYSSDGYLYLAENSSSSTIYKINPSSGVSVGSITISTAQTVVDLATCNYANSLRGQVDIRSRAAVGDQFGVVNSGNGISSGNTMVTSGSTLNLQPGSAGPNLTLGGLNYTVTLTAAGTTDLADYSIGWSCVNRTTSTTVASGTGAIATFTNPMTSTADGTDVVCTFITAVLPKANDDAYTTTIGTTKTTTAATGLIDPNDTGASITVTSNTPASHGTVTVAADGSFSYVPTAGYTGSDTFDYTITDVNGTTSTATVTIDIDPVANPDSYSTPSGTPIVISDLTANDGPTTMTVQSVTAPSHGTAVLNGDGTVTYTPTAGYTGADSFTYTAETGAGLTASTTVTITVAAAAVDDQSTGSPDTVTVITPLTNDKPTGGFTFDPTTLRIQDPNTLAWVTLVTVPGVGTWQVVGDEIRFSPVSGYSGTTSIDYRVDDTAGNTVNAKATVVYLPTIALAYTNVQRPGIEVWGLGAEGILLGLALVLFAGIRRRRQAMRRHRAA